MLASSDAVRAAWWWLLGVVMGLAMGVLMGAARGAAIAAALADAPTTELRNGILEGWDVTRDDDARLCTDPMVFVRAKQIECP